MTTINIGPETGHEILVKELAASKSKVILTGAGISTWSEIPDFRSPARTWTKYRIVPFDEFPASAKAHIEDWRRRFEMGDILGDFDANNGQKKLQKS